MTDLVDNLLPGDDSGSQSVEVSQEAYDYASTLASDTGNDVGFVVDAILLNDQGLRDGSVVDPSAADIPENLPDTSGPHA